MSACATCGRAFDHDETTLGGFLRARREERGWSLRKVAEISGGKISCPYLSQVEMGHQKELGASKVLALASVYGISIEGLIRLAAGLSYEPEPMPDLGLLSALQTGEGASEALAQAKGGV